MNGDITFTFHAADVWPVIKFAIGLLYGILIGSN